MMETVLNVGLCSKTIPGLIKKSGNERFVYDAYRRLIMMYSDVVMEKAEDIEPAEGKGIRVQLDDDHGQDARQVDRRLQESDTDLTADDLKQLCEQFKSKVQEVLGQRVPRRSAWSSFGARIGAVFKSWDGSRAVSYRRIEGIPDEWGTACNVQTMVFGNMGDTSATGVAFTRNPATGENKFYGEWLVNAQGEDVVAGIRTPNPLNEATKNEQNQHLPSLRNRDGPSCTSSSTTSAPSSSSTTTTCRTSSSRSRKASSTCSSAATASGPAPRPEHGDGHARREGLIDEKTPSCASQPAQLDELLHPIVDPAAEKTAEAFRRACRPGRAARWARSCSPRPTRWKRPSRARRSSSSAKRPTPRTSKACARPRAF